MRVRGKIQNLIEISIFYACCACIVEGSLVARLGRDKILSGDCFTVVQDYDNIVDQMTVPLIQGMLKYAFKADPANDQGSCQSGSCDKARTIAQVESEWLV